MDEERNPDRLSGRPKVTEPEFGPGSAALPAGAGARLPEPAERRAPHPPGVGRPLPAAVAGRGDKGAAEGRTWDRRARGGAGPFKRGGPAARGAGRGREAGRAGPEGALSSGRRRRRRALVLGPGSRSHSAPGFRPAAARPPQPRPPAPRGAAAMPPRRSIVEVKVLDVQKRRVPNKHYVSARAPPGTPGAPRPRKLLPPALAPPRRPGPRLRPLPSPAPLPAPRPAASHPPSSPRPRSPHPFPRPRGPLRSGPARPWESGRAPAGVGAERGAPAPGPLLGHRRSDRRDQPQVAPLPGPPGRAAPLRRSRGSPRRGRVLGAPAP